MDRRTQVLIGLAVVALGVGAWALGLADGEGNVRRVEDVVAAPQRYSAGSTVLLGVPQPPQVPVAAAEGTVLRANPGWANLTSSTVRWTDDAGAVWYSTRTVTAQADGDATRWTYRNETRVLPSDPAPAVPAVVVEWTTEGGRVFAIEAFRDATQDTPRIWGLYDGVLKDPMQPKPSQFTGRLLDTLPDGRPVPDGAFLYDVDEFKAGCSSKFLPPEEKERLAESGDL
jgi:hypothetical protein